MKISRNKLNEELALKEDEDNHPLGQYTEYWVTKRIITSIEFDFGETEPEHNWRILVDDSARKARRGLSARSIAEGTHWGQLVGKDLNSEEKRKDEQRRKLDLPTLAEQRAYDERELWVLAYINYTAFYGPDEQYIAALRYYEEIKRRPRPIPGEIL